MRVSNAGEESEWMSLGVKKDQRKMMVGRGPQKRKKDDGEEERMKMKTSVKMYLYSRGHSINCWIRVVSPPLLLM